MTPGGLVLLTDRRAASQPLVPLVAAAVRGGVSWVILRERDLPYGDRWALAAALREVLPPGRLIVAGPDPLGGDAVHLAEADAEPTASVALVGRSRHAASIGGVGRQATAGGELRAVAERGTASTRGVEHYVTLSPIYPTASKPGHGPALGPAAAAALAGERAWLALGGIDSAERAAACAVAGATGVAVMGALMRAADPAALAGALAAAFVGESLVDGAR